MLTLPPSVKIFIAAAPVRMSKSFDGLVLSPVRIRGVAPVCYAGA